MVAKEYCCYTRPYSSIEGFQIAHTLYYSASVEEEGVVDFARGFGNCQRCSVCKFVVASDNEVFKGIFRI